MLNKHNQGNLYDRWPQIWFNNLNAKTCKIYKKFYMRI